MHNKAFRFVFVAAMPIFFSACSSLLYYPTKVQYVNEKLLEVKPLDVQLPTEKQDSLHAWYFKNKNNKADQPNILFFHGNGQNLSSHFYSLYWILEHDLNFLIIDYPGYGKSSGAPSPENTIQTGLAAIDWLKTTHPNSSIAVFGQSLGGAVAMKTLIEAKAKFEPCQVTIEASFDSYQDVGRDAMSKSWLTWIFQPLAYLFLSDKHAPEGQLKELPKTHKLVIHSEGDPVIDVKFGKRLFKELEEPKDLIIVKGRRHAANFNGTHKEKVRREYLAALNKHCRKKK